MGLLIASTELNHQNIEEDVVPQLALTKIYKGRVIQYNCTIQKHQDRTKSDQNTYQKGNGGIININLVSNGANEINLLKVFLQVPLRATGMPCTRKLGLFQILLLVNVDQKFCFGKCQ